VLHEELDTAYELLTQRECPSWLYPVSMGATTVWERWDSLLPDAGDTLTVTATVLPGTRAEVDLPCGATPVEVGAGTHTFTGHWRPAQEP
jgi:hypothetical protein